MLFIGDNIGLNTGISFMMKTREGIWAIERAFSIADRALDSDSRLSTLDQSILAKAFRGELVPQDLTDEPACVLLERIKAGRAAQTAPKKRRTT